MILLYNVASHRSWEGLIYLIVSFFMWYSEKRQWACQNLPLTAIIFLTIITSSFIHSFTKFNCRSAKSQIFCCCCKSAIPSSPLNSILSFRKKNSIHMLRSAFNQKYPLGGALYFILILGYYSWEGVGTKKK